MRPVLAPKVAVVEEDMAVAEEDKVTVEEDTAVAEEDKVVVEEGTAAAEEEGGAADKDQRVAVASNIADMPYVSVQNLTSKKYRYCKRI
jgi:hypothetical protein